MDKDPNQSWLELIIPKGILEYFTIVGFDKGGSGKYVYDKTQDQVPILSLNIIFAKISFTSFTFSSKSFYNSVLICWLETNILHFIFHLLNYPSLFHCFVRIQHSLLVINPVSLRRIYYPDSSFYIYQCT